MRKLGIALLLVGVLAGAAFGAYPENIQGYIMWGAGGAMDNVSQAIVPIAQEHLPERPSSCRTGPEPLEPSPQLLWRTSLLTATAFSSAQRIRTSTRSPAFPQIDYDQFEPVFLMMANVGVVIVSKDSPTPPIGISSRQPPRQDHHHGFHWSRRAALRGHNHDRAKIHGVKFNKMQFDGKAPHHRPHGRTH